MRVVTIGAALFLVASGARVTQLSMSDQLGARAILAEARPGAPVVLSLVEVRAVEEGLLEVSAGSGWDVRLVPSDEPVAIGEIVTLRAVVGPSGVPVVGEVIRHPRRWGKLWVSLGGVLLFAALLPLWVRLRGRLIFWKSMENG